MTNKIVIDGKVYNSIQEMPEDVRVKYEQALKAFGKSGSMNPMNLPGLENVFADNDNNGTPDIFEQLGTSNFHSIRTKIIHNGKEFNSIEGLPPEIQAKYNNAMKNLDKNHNGILDIFENIQVNTNQKSSIQSQPQSDQPIARRSVPSPQSSQPAITPDTSNGLGLLIMGGLLMLICLASAAGVWYFFIR